MYKHPSIFLEAGFFGPRHFSAKHIYEGAYLTVVVYLQGQGPKRKFAAAHLSDSESMNVALAFSERPCVAARPYSKLYVSKGKLMAMALEFPALEN